MIEHRPGFVVGFRVWEPRLYGDGIALASLTADAVWDHRRMTAECGDKKTCSLSRLYAHSTIAPAQHEEWSIKRIVAWLTPDSVQITVRLGDKIHEKVITVKGGRNGSAQIDREVAEMESHMRRVAAGKTLAAVNRALKEVDARPPTPDHTCGLWACNTASAAWSTGRALDRADQLVLGAVIGSGRVIVHELGWRSQHAQVLALSALPKLKWTISVLAKRYGVPLVDPRYLEAYALEHGATAKAT